MADSVCQIQAKTEKISASPVSEWKQETIPFLPHIRLFIAAVRKLLSREVDFVHYPSLKNPYFIAEVEGTKTLLYAKEPQKISI